MKKSIFFSILTFFAIFVLVSCKGKQGSHRTYDGQTIYDIMADQDTTLNAILNEVVEDTIIKVTYVTDGTQDMFNIKDAVESNMIHGRLNPGDSLAIMPLGNTKSLKSLINLSELLGLWLFKGGDGSGFNLLPNGCAMGVGQVDDICLKQWFVHNGMLIITYIPADGSDYVERADTTLIEKLNDNELSVVLNGIDHVCKHQTEIITK
ncbi:MAG: hypothetical protein MJZ20_03500 [Bacteroidaceae bacterium]|nr:hypothetical protein [Bacteroidaceae bacterium]